MISRCIAGSFAFAFFVSGAVAVQDLTLDQILKKNEDAIGGGDAISKVQTIRTTSRMVMSDGQTEMVTTVASKRPNLIRSETAVIGSYIVLAYDGTTAWMINPLTGGSEPQKMDEATSAGFTNARMDSSIGALLGIKAAGNTIELLGKEDVMNTAPPTKPAIAKFRHSFGVIKGAPGRLRVT